MLREDFVVHPHLRTFTKPNRLIRGKASFLYFQSRSEGSLERNKTGRIGILTRQARGQFGFSYGCSNTILVAKCYKDGARPAHSHMQAYFLRKGQYIQVTYG